MEGYAAARIHAMRARLLKGEEYERLLRMSDKEVIAFLQASEYRKDVDALALKDLGDLEAIDIMLANNTRRVTEKLERISGRRFRQALRGILEANDAWNITILGEAIAGGHDTRGALRQFSRYGTFRAEQYARAKSIQELTGMLRKRLPFLRHVTTLPELARALLLQRSRCLEGADPYTRDEWNIMMLVQALRENIRPGTAVQHLIGGGTISPRQLRWAAQEGLTGLFRMLRTTQYRAIAERDPDSLLQFENELHAQVLNSIRSMTRTKPTGTALLTNYLAEKDREHKNLRVLIKGKRLGLDEAFIRRHVIA